jgi:hypothetical protein
MTKKQTSPSKTICSSLAVSKFRMPFRQLPLMNSRTDSSQSKTGSTILQSLRKLYTQRGLQTSSRLRVKDGYVSATPEQKKESHCILSAAHFPSRKLLSSNIPFHVKTLPAERKSSRSLVLKTACHSTVPLKLAVSSDLECGFVSETDDDTDDETDVSGNEYDSIEPNRTYSICFNTQVEVVEIPHRLTYSAKQRRRMWNGRKVIRENAKRNRMEYAWENSSWQNAVEEDKFCEINGVKVHPSSVIRRS